MKVDRAYEPTVCTFQSSSKGYRCCENMTKPPAHCNIQRPSRQRQFRSGQAVDGTCNGSVNEGRAKGWGTVQTLTCQQACQPRRCGSDLSAGLHETLSAVQLPGFLCWKSLSHSAQPVSEGQTYTCIFQTLFRIKRAEAQCMG